MKESLGLLATRLENLDTLGDPKKDTSFASSQSSVTAQFADTIPLIEISQQAILDRSQSLCDTIQRYVTLVNPSVSSRNRDRTVASLPNETMLEIFRFLVVDGSHHLQPLLLVNKRVHALVTSAPSLWCNISIAFDGAFQECNNLSVRYIRSCIKYSGNSFLNISLDLADMADPLHCAASILEIVKEEVPRFNDVIELTISIIRGFDWLEDDAFFTRRWDKVGSLMHAIAGKNGTHTRRWRSFRLSPPEADFHSTRRLLPLLKYRMPNLETFVVHGPLFDEFDEFPYYEFVDFNAGFPKLAAVRHLTLNDTSAFQLASFSRHLLITAVVERFSRGSTLNVFSGCEELQELTIANVDEYLFGQWREKSPEDVELPSLKKLTLRGRVSALKNVTFRTPRLDILMLFCGCEEDLPNLRARSVVWMPNAEKNLGSMVKFLQLLLGEIKEIEEIVVQCEQVESVNMAEHAVRDIVARRDAIVVETPLVIRIVSEGFTVDVTQIGNN
ncbi:hypothetical protein FRC17_008114 [Serendipita sp. 399]|nr:hypothetical protein FRC17_008114 [Serendipita sp. 399]